MTPVKDANAGLIKGDFAAEQYCAPENKVSQQIGPITYTLCHNGDNLGLIEFSGLDNFLNYTEPMEIGISEPFIENVYLSNENFGGLFFNGGDSLGIYYSNGLEINNVHDFKLGYELKPEFKFGNYLSGKNETVALDIFDYHGGNNFSEYLFKPDYKFNVIDKTSTNPTTSVPEPITISILGLSLAGLAASRRKKDNK